MAAVKVLAWPGLVFQDRLEDCITSELVRYGQESLSALGIDVDLGADVSYAKKFVDTQVPGVKKSKIKCAD
jgi:hypothetical protein